MSNDNLKKAEELRVRQQELNNKFYRLFNTDDGKVVFQHLFDSFVMKNDTPLDAQNVEYEAGYHAGEAGVIKYISQRMSNSQR